ncbi:alpha/beta hydrolase [Calidifontibacter terrae]
MRANGFDRLEYQFVAGRRAYLDPANPLVVQTDFGPRSEWRAASYVEPAWLSAPATPGTLTTLELPSALAKPLSVQVWQPEGLGDSPAPLMWCHDGSGYLKRARIDQWAGSKIAAGELPPMRIALSDAPRRMQWYSGSPRYLRSVRRALDDLHQRYAINAPVAVIGASLGGLTSLLIGMSDPRVGAVFSQSGSFFDPRIDTSDNVFRWFDRIAVAVDGIRATPTRAELLIGMTCGAKEENENINAALWRHLRAGGWDASYEANPDLHNWVGWRDCLDPILPNLLQRAWSAVG